jgi:hypothetical protein
MSLLSRACLPRLPSLKPHLVKSHMTRKPLYTNFVNSSSCLAAHSPRLILAHPRPVRLSLLDTLGLTQRPLSTANDHFLLIMQTQVPDVSNKCRLLALPGGEFFCLRGCYRDILTL